MRGGLELRSLAAYHARACWRNRLCPASDRAGCDVAYAGSPAGAQAPIAQITCSGPRQRSSRSSTNTVCSV